MAACGKGMVRFDKACILVALLSVPLLWLFSPSPRSEPVGAGAKGADSWQVPARPEKKDLAKIKARLIAAPALGFVPPKQAEEAEKATARKEGVTSFYGTFQLGTGITALVEKGGVIQLCREGDVLADGSTVLAISTNSVKILLPDGTEKKVALYEESL